MLRRLLEALGVQADFQGPLKVRFSRRFYLLLGGWALVAFCLLLGGVKYSESPTFCNSCHIMEPYYKAWKASKHNQVACIDCHYPPAAPKTLLWKKFQAFSQVAKYVTRTYSSKPFAEVEDSSCLRSGCHSQRLLEGKVLSKTGIKFDHRPHLIGVRRGRQLRCVSCHSQVMVGSHIEVTYDTCYLCHFKGKGEGRGLKPVAGCLACHDLPAKTFQLGNMRYNHKDFVQRQGVSCVNCHIEAVQGKGEAPKERCFTCHNQPEKLERYGDTPFLHENHVTKHNIACLHCHQEMRHGFTEGRGSRLPAPGAAPQQPAAPHPPAVGFECSYCHQGTHAGQLEMYTGKAAPLGLPDMPSPMHLARVDCVGCHFDAKPDGHLAEFSGQTARAAEKACVQCHGLKFKGIWEGTSAELQAGLKQVSAKLDAAKAALAKAPAGKERASAASAVSKAERYVLFVKDSHGEHNIYLASDVLRRADKALAGAGGLLKADLPDASASPLISGSYCATLCHEKVGVKVPAETVKVFGKILPHKAHSELAACTQCHELGAHKKAPLRKDLKSVCAGCHPDQ